MSGVNKAIVLGRLGGDPELKRLDNEQVLCKFSMATSESWNDKQSGEKKENTQWHNVIVWGKLAEICNQYLAKGRQAYVEGKLQTTSWDDDNGVKHYKTEIVANTVQFVGSNDGEQKPKNQPNEYKKPETNADFAADSIPF